MKNLTLKSLIVALVMFPLMLSAQGKSSIDDLYNQYSGIEGFTSVNISKTMFAFFAKMEGVEDKDFNEMQDVLETIDGLKILSCDAKDPEKISNFKKEVKKMLNAKKFEELMVVKEQDSDVQILLRNEGDDIVELLLVANEADDVAVISFFGIIDLAAISKLSETMKIDGMDHLHGLDKYKNK